MKTKTMFISAALVLLILNLLSLPLLGQGTAFTYQGSLNDGPGKANGVYDLQFNIYDAANAGNLLAGPLTNAATHVTNGLFTVTLDFGSGVFTGSPRWLDLGVRTNGAVSFLPLTPRQALMPTPYAITASNLSGTLPASQLSGALRVSGNVANLIGGNTFNAVMQPNSGGNTIAGGGIDGGGNLIQANSSDNFIGAGSQNVIGPNATNSFVGAGQANWNLTSDAVIGGGSQNLILTNSPYGVIGGGNLNVLGANADSSVIGGGYYNSNLMSVAFIGGGVGNFANTNLAEFFLPAYGFIGGGYFNTVSGNGAVIVGGFDNINNGQVGFIGAGKNNIANGDYSVVVGGGYNEAGGGGSFVGGGGFDGLLFGGNHADADGSAVVGGITNVINPGANRSFIGSGYANLIQSNSPESVIAGGNRNVIGFTAGYSTIGGGYLNSVQSNASYSVIVGGQHNTNFDIGTFVGGGSGNMAAPGSGYSVIGGGLDVTIGTNAFESVIAGGEFNMINSSSALSAIGGGYSNIISGLYSTIPGGFRNAASGAYSFAAGRQANALHLGAFVWADSTGSGFASTANNQFLIRASGGVGINKNNPATALDVAGTITATGFSGDGANLTLSTNVAFVNHSQTFTGTNVFMTGLNSGGALIVNSVPSGSGGGIDTSTFTGLGFQYYAGIGEGAIISSYNDGYAFLGFYTKAGVGLPVTRRMMINTNGNVGIANNSPTNLLMVANARCDGSAWINASDRNLKEHFAPVDSALILSKVVGLPLSHWNYKNDPTPHLGPVAQDFYAQFNLGADDKSIATVDEGGVALAAIQGLNKKLEAQSAELAEKDKRIAALEQAVTELKSLITQSRRVAAEN